jgi:hypothetical protein
VSAARDLRQDVAHFHSVDDASPYIAFAGSWIDASSNVVNASLYYGQTFHYTNSSVRRAAYRDASFVLITPRARMRLRLSISMARGFRYMDLATLTTYVLA